MATTPTTTSRYAPASTASSSGATDSQSSGTASGTQTATTSGTQTTAASTQNMDPQSLAALQTLIAQLMGGGTQAMANDQAARKGEIKNVQAQRAGYSKEAAFADAQGLMAQTMRQVMERLIPSISRSAEGAGASQSSLRALLLQDAASKAAESSAAQGLNAAVNYGQVSGGMNQVLEALTRPDNTVSNALLQALQIAKGAVQNTQGVTQTNQTVTTDTATKKNDAVDYAPFQTVAPSQAMTYYGPTAERGYELDFQGTSSRNRIIQLLNNAQDFSNFTF
jgi:hypothetical protein